MGELNYVMLLASYEEELKAYSHAQIGRMLMGLLHLLNTGEEYVPVGNEKYIWPTLRGQYQRNLETYRQKCAVNKASSIKGVEARKAKRLAEATERLPETTERLPNGYKEKENENVNVNENENVNVNEKDNFSFYACGGREKESISFPHPDVSSVLEFCRAEGLSNVDAQLFVDYYTSVGWKMGDKPMRSWQAAARLWNSKSENRKEKTDGGDYSAAARYGIIL